MCPPGSRCQRTIAGPISDNHQMNFSGRNFDMLSMLGFPAGGSVPEVEVDVLRTPLCESSTGWVAIPAGRSHSPSGPCRRDSPALIAHQAFAAALNETVRYGRSGEWSVVSTGSVPEIIHFVFAVIRISGNDPQDAADHSVPVLARRFRPAIRKRALPTQDATSAANQRVPFSSFSGPCSLPTALGGSNRNRGAAPADAPDPAAA